MKVFSVPISILICLFTFLSLKAQSSYSCEKWTVLDIPFTPKATLDNPLDVNFGAEITHEDGQTMTIPGFYNGDNTWVLRFAPPEEGQWVYLTYSTIPSLAGQQGLITAQANTKPDEHGPIVISKDNPQRFAYADGTPYLLTAFELDWLFALDWDNPTGIPKSREIIKEIKQNGFNQVVMNVYAYDAGWGERDKIRAEHNYAKPKVFPFGGTNEKPDYNTLNISFFKHLDRVIAHLDEQEVVAHLMIYVWNKKVNWPEPNSQADNRYFDYVVKRYQAFPNLIWDISKEALDYGRDDMSYITERIDRLRKLDGHQRLLSVHDYLYCSARPDKVDFISIQEWNPNLYNAMRTVAETHPKKPIFNIEHGGYERTRHFIFQGAYSDPVTCLDRNYQCLFAGAYSTYYWQNTSWYEVVYNPLDLPEEEQPNLSWYKHMVKLFEAYKFEELEPVQYTFTPYFLTDHKSVYLFHVTQNMDKVTGKIPALRGKTVQIKWFDPFTGTIYTGEKRTFNNGIWLGFSKDQRVTAPFSVAILEVLE